MPWGVAPTPRGLGLLACICTGGLRTSSAVPLTLDTRGFFRNGTALFFPVGVNYWPASTGCNLWSIPKFPSAEINHDFAVLARSPFNTVRIFLTWGELEPEEGTYDEEKFANFASMLGLAAKHGLVVDVSAFVGWMSGRLYWPSWKRGRNLYTDPAMITRSRAFALKVATVAARYRDTILALEYGNEMDCCTDKAGSTDIIAWTRTIYAAFKEGCPGAPVVPGTDENTVFGDTGWPLGGVTGQIAGDLFNLHPYPVLFTPTKGDGFFDGVTQAGPTYDAAFVRAHGPAFMQEWGTLVTGGVVQQDSYLRRILPESLRNGVNGWLYWCMRDIATHTTAPYNLTGLETQLGLFNVSDQIKPGLEYFGEFAAHVTSMSTPPVLAEDTPDAVGLYWPVHTFRNGDPAAVNATPPAIQAGHATLAYHLLHDVGETARVIRGDLPLPAPISQLRVLVVTSALLSPAEIEALAKWVREGGVLLWHGLTPEYFNTAATASLVGARLANTALKLPLVDQADIAAAAAAATSGPNSDREMGTPTSEVVFGGRRWGLTDWISDTPPTLVPSTAARVWTDNTNRTVMTLTQLGSGRVFAAVPAIDSTTLRLAGTPGARDVWGEWYATALSCARGHSCDTLRQSRSPHHKPTPPAARLLSNVDPILPNRNRPHRKEISPAPSRTTKGNNAGATVYSASSQYLDSAKRVVGALEDNGVTATLFNRTLRMPSDIHGNTLVVPATMPLPEQDVAYKWVEGGADRCLVWSGITSRTFNPAMYTTFGVAAVDIRTAVNSTVVVFDQTFVLDGFADSLHITFDGKVPQRLEWGVATAVAVDQRGIVVVHRRKEVGGSGGGTAVLVTPSAERSSFNASALARWYRVVFELCPSGNS